MKEQLRTCKDCIHFDKHHNSDSGYCRRHAPMPRITDVDPKYWPDLSDGPFTQWPTVDGEIDWCGDIKLEDK